MTNNSWPGSCLHWLEQCFFQQAAICCRFLHQFMHQGPTSYAIYIPAADLVKIFHQRHSQQYNFQRDSGCFAAEMSWHAERDDRLKKGSNNPLHCSMSRSACHHTASMTVAHLPGWTGCMVTMASLHKSDGHDELRRCHYAPAVITLYRMTWKLFNALICIENTSFSAFCRSRFQ